MTDFEKEKIAFAIGLLAVLFTLTPVLGTYGSIGFELLRVRFEIRHLYLILATSLGLSVYCYGVRFLTRRSIRGPAIAGDAFYAIAIVAPALYASLYLTATLVTAITPFVRSPSVQNAIQLTLSALLGGVSVLFAQRAWRSLELRQKQSDARLRVELEVGSLRRAQTLLNDAHYDLAVIEAYRALEIAARAAVHPPAGRAGAGWFLSIMQSLPAELRPSLEQVRNVRNKAAHGVERVTEEAARHAIATISKALALIAGAERDKCPECHSTDFIQESGSDHGFAWTRGRCLKCGYLDLG